MTVFIILKATPLQFTLSLSKSKGWPYVIFDSLSNPAFRSISFAFPSTAPNSSPNPFRTINTPSHPGLREGSASRTDSRTSRFRRFLPTARLSTLTGTTNANREPILLSSRPLSRDPVFKSADMDSLFLNIREIPSPFKRLPSLMTDLISGEGRRCSRGSIND